jgi:hypothetical protein
MISPVFEEMSKRPELSNVNFYKVRQKAIDRLLIAIH